MISKVHSTMPSVSVIVSTLNDGDKLQMTIESFINQDYENKELLVIDGLSTDSTAEICKKYQNVISVYVSEKDSGIYDAWNKGLKFSKGEWITFLGAGDRFFRNDTITNLIESFNLQNSNFISGIIYLEDKRNNFAGKLGKEWNLKALKNNISIGHPGSMHHRSLFKLHGNFNVNYQISGDYEFLLRASKSISAKFYPYYVVKMDNLGLSNTKPFKAIFESAMAMRSNKEFGLYLSLRYTLLSVVKLMIKKLIINNFIIKKLNQ